MAETLRVGMVGLGMIFDETYLPAFLDLQARPILNAERRPVDVRFASVASRTGSRVGPLRSHPSGSFNQVSSFDGIPCVTRMLAESSPDVVCVATPDDRHFAAALEVLNAGKHLILEKPSVLSLSEVDQLLAAKRSDRQALVVYHKLLDPDHKRLRTLVIDDTLRHVNSGYCTLMEPKQISTGQFAEWVNGRNPATYVAVHYLKLIDFTFGPTWRLKSIQAAGQRGIVREPTSDTWDSVQLRVTYEHADLRTATFDIHTSWVHPDNFPGYVDQEVQFRFDNGVWNAHQRKRGVELTIEDRTPGEIKITPNHHYNAELIEPWGGRTRRGYGVEAVRRCLEEIALAPDGSPAPRLPYNSLEYDRVVVAVVQSLEWLLGRLRAGFAGAWVEADHAANMLVGRDGVGGSELLYSGPLTCGGGS